jgi:hypothetical protein
MMSEHCLFCDREVVYTNGFPPNAIFGLCENHAYINYRTKSGRPRKRPQFNFVFTKKAWAWAKEKAEAEMLSPKSS